MLLFYTEAKYTGNQFLKLTEERLNELGVSIGFKHTVIDIIANIKEANEVCMYYYYIQAGGLASLAPCCT
jgi:hypothetical protein